MPEVDISPRAQDDLDDIAARSGQDSIEKAYRVITAIFKTFDRLAQFPYLGRLRSRFAPNLRSFVVRPYPYMVFYYPTKDGVEIVHVLDGRRNLERIFRDDLRS